MRKRNRIKGQTTIYKTLLRNIKIEQHEPRQKKTNKTRLNSIRVSRSCSNSVNYFNWYCWNIFILYQSSRWALVLRPKTSKTLFGPVHFSCSFYLELHKNKFKNLNQISKFKFSFRRTQCLYYVCVVRWELYLISPSWNRYYILF